jgi:transposase-like protein
MPPVDPRDEMLAMADSQFTKENPCACSAKYRELAPGVHAAYCPLAGRPLDNGRQRWTCSSCKITWLAADGEAAPVDRCIKCGGSTVEVSRG